MSRTEEFEQILSEVRSQVDRLAEVDRVVSAIDTLGYSPDRMVAVSVRGAGEIREVTIHPEAMQRHDAASLGRAVTRAIVDALAQAHGQLAEACPDVFGDLVIADDMPDAAELPAAVEAWTEALTADGVGGSRLAG